MLTGQPLRLQALRREEEESKEVRGEDLNAVSYVYHVQREEESLLPDETTKAAKTVSMK